MSEHKQKIAVLGGGMAALTAVFELTSRPGWADRYEITVYQMGHRLGGKGASGRNAKHADRIEEHGLHILMGFYHNAFSVLRRCYEELGRAPGTPLATIEDAVKPHHFLVLADQVDGRWEPWPLRFPPIAGKPGKGPPAPVDPLGYLEKVLAWMHGLLIDSADAGAVASDIFDAESIVDALLGHERPKGGLESPGMPRAGARGLDARDVDPDRLRALIDRTGPREETIFGALSSPAGLYLAKLAFAVGLRDAGPDLLPLLRTFRDWLAHALEDQAGRTTGPRRLWAFLDLGLTTVIGAIDDGVLTAPDDWFSLDELDLRAWLAKHGASEVTREGALVRSLYNLAFTARGKLAAGTIVHAALRIVFDYKDGVFQKMQAGMGDVVFAPLYLVLKRRGVKFAFFHRVDEVVVSEDKKRVVALEVGRQVRVRGGDYDPLQDVGGLPCWPSEPRYAELEDGEALRASGQNLESGWSTWPDVERLRLEVGKDFDRVILGISIGAFPFVCKQLIAANERFAAMVEHVKTTQTQAVQLWFEGPLGELGWTLESPVLDGFADPFDTWADMSHLLPQERWAGAGAPRNVSYLCSNLEDDEEPPGRGAAGYPERQAARVKANAIAWLHQHAHWLWPGVARPGGFDWGRLVDPEGRQGVARLEAQYWQATYSPSERYVLAVPGSTRHRLRADASGFENLVLAGDWVRNGINSGCIEGAVMGGMQAARAISGWPEQIPGDE